MANYAKKVLYGSVAVFVISIASAFISYLIRLVLARSISVSDYGMFYAVLSLFSLVALFRTLGLNSFLAKAIPEYIHRKDYMSMKGAILLASALQFISSGIVAIASIIFSAYIAKYYFHTESASILIAIIAIMFWLMPLEGITRSIFQGMHKVYHYAAFEFVRVCIILVSTLVLLNLGFGVLSPAYSYALGYGIIFFIFLPMLLRSLPSLSGVKARIDKEIMKKMILFGLPVMIGIFGSYLLIYTDTLVLTYFRSLEEVGLYQVASPTSQIVLYFGYAVSTVLLPLSSEFWLKRKKDKIKKILELVYKYSFILILPLTLMIISFPQLILKILFGESYIMAALPLQILSFGVIFYTVANINGNILSGIGKPGENAKMVLLAAVLNLILNIILVPRYGNIGAACSTMISYFMILALTTYKIRHFIMIKLPLMDWVKNLFAAFIFVFVIYLLKGWLVMNVYAEAFISVAAASVVYLLLVFAFRLITMKDVAFFRYALGMEKKFLEEEEA